MARKVFPIQLDRVRNFRFGNLELAKAEDMIGKPLKRILADINELTLKEFAMFMWAGLSHEDRDLTWESILEIMDDNNISLDTVAKVLQNALEESFSPKNG